MYPLLVATKSQSPSRRQAAQAVLEMLRTHSATLVDQAQVCVWGGACVRARVRVCVHACVHACVQGVCLHTHLVGPLVGCLLVSLTVPSALLLLLLPCQLVSGELIRIAILWHEQWHEALEEASRWGQAGGFI